MDMTTIGLAVVALVFGTLWMMRRRSRLRNDVYE